MNIRVCTYFIVVIVTLIASQAAAQTETTFTYQGELNQSGQPANGNFNLTFSLWDSLQNGSQVLGDLQINAVPVSDGTFTVNLDFGANAFNNANRWLEIEVNGQTLAPRQFVSRSPYSIQTRGIYVASDGKVGVGTTAPVADLEIDGTASPDTGLMVRAPGGATGQVAVSSPGGETGIIGIANGGNRRDIRFTDDGISLLTNSSPTIPSSINGLVITENGHVGIGTTSPPISSTFYATADSSLGAAVDGHYVNPTGNGIGVGGRSDSPTGWAGFFTGGRNFFQGNVGIGVLDPQYQLSVDGGVRMQGLPVGVGTSLVITPGSLLARQVSSRRYKEDIEFVDLSEAAEAFIKLQPVSYKYIGSSDTDIGLIAEDVAELVPDMVVFDTDGRPDSVKYNKGVLYLLDLAKSQRAEIEQLNQRIDALEQLLADTLRGL